MAALSSGDSSHHGTPEEIDKVSQEKLEVGGGRRYFSKKEIEENSPSRQDGIDLKKETDLRRRYSRFIQDLGKALGVPRVAIATAIVFCHRFFLCQSHAKNEWKIISTVFMFLACKVEDSPRPLSAFIQINKVKLPSGYGRVWWKEFDVTPEQLKEICCQLLVAYNRNRASRSQASKAKGSGASSERPPPLIGPANEEHIISSKASALNKSTDGNEGHDDDDDQEGNFVKTQDTIQVKDECDRGKNLSSKDRTTAPPLAQEAYDKLDVEKINVGAKRRKVSGGHLPYELSELTLLNMEMKSLLRFKSVSRFWKEMIFNVKFMQKHLSRSKDLFSKNPHFVWKLRHWGFDFCVQIRWPKIRKGPRPRTGKPSRLPFRLMLLQRGDPFKELLTPRLCFVESVVSSDNEI